MDSSSFTKLSLSFVCFRKRYKCYDTWGCIVTFYGHVKFSSQGYNTASVKVQQFKMSTEIIHATEQKSLIEQLYNLAQNSLTTTLDRIAFILAMFF